LRNVLYEQRVIIYKTQLLRDELVGLQKDNTTGKVDHTKLGINCLKGDTQIQLVDGRALSIKDLVEEHQRGVENFVYSINEETLKIEPKRIINAWMSGKDAPLVEVTLDNGEKIRCTPEHRFMLRDRQYCEAQNLVCGDLLMPLHTKISQRVVSVEFIQERADVYDIEVEDNHNFALSAGMFVHNSKDQADAFCGSLYNASLHAEEYAFEYGESIDTMIDISLGRDDMLDSLLTPIDYEAYKPKALAYDYDSGFSNGDFMMSQGILLL